MVKPIPNQTGFASIALIIFTVMATTMITAATFALINSTFANTQSEQSAIALDIAESGAENGLARFSRDIGYSGEELSFDGGIAYITLPNSTTIQSRGVYGNLSRTVQVNITDYINTNNLTINSWQEIF